MPWVWNPIALVGIIGGLLAWTMAALVLRARPDRWQNRFLALFFALEGAYGLWASGIRLLLFGDESVRFVMAMGYSLIFFGTPIIWWAYFAFLSTVESPISEFLRRPWFQGLVGVALAAVAVHVLVAPDAYLRGLIPWRHLDAWQYDVGWASRTILFWIPPAVDLLGIAVAVTGLRAARTAALRRQFVLYTAAFVSYDTLNIGWYLLLNLEVNNQNSPAGVEMFYFVLGPVGLIVLTLLLGYAVLKTQLFDIDIRIKGGVRRGIVLAPFAIVFFVLTETLADALPFAGYWAGLVGAGLVALAFAPIHRLSHRLVDRLFPRVADTTAYRQSRKEEVYTAALEGAYRDGKVSETERDVLSSLVRSLGLARGRARELEAQFVQR